MPTVFSYQGVRFFFYSNEGSPREPVHIHARGNGGDAKFWLRPEVVVAYCEGFTRKEQLDFIRVVETQREEIERAWNEHFGS
jgi:hypothetical protein